MEVETNLDRWYGTRSGYMCILEEVDLDEQEFQVQEFVNVLTQIAHLRYFKDKFEINVNRIHRLVKKVEIEVISRDSSKLKKLLYL